MIVRIEDMKSICSKISAALDVSENDLITSVIQLKTENEFLNLIVSNREYYIKVKLNLYEYNNFNATVSANQFLNLIANTTSDTVEFTFEDNFLKVEGNGTYKLPLIYEGENMLNVPEININNVTQRFNIEKDILMSILNYNSKELLKATTMAKPVQKLYYIDEEGCITFTSGACVNKFSLERPIKMLLTQKVVKLFKLFSSEHVAFNYGYDPISDEMLQTKCRFEDESVQVTAILPSETSLLSSVPVTAIRSRAFDQYTTSVVLNKTAFLETIKRLSIFTAKVEKPTVKIDFNSCSLVITDVNSKNCETIYYEGDTSLSSTYQMFIDLNDLKLTLDGCAEQFVTVQFGNHIACVIARGNVYNVIPEKSA